MELWLNGRTTTDVVSEVVSGCASGVDTMGEAWAFNHGITIKRFPADWSKGQAAGYFRNADMAHYGNVLVAIWDGVSRGTAHMIACAIAQGLEVWVFRTDKIMGQGGWVEMTARPEWNLFGGISERD